MSDGKFGDRALETIKDKFRNVSMVLVEPRDAREIIDEYEFPPGAREQMQGADLIISYVTHPDINLELAGIGKPLLIAIDLGRGLIQQARDINPNVFMPSTMCHLEPVTGIGAIDEFAGAFGLPRYEITLDSSRMRIASAATTVESPCGATRRSLPILVGAPLTPETLNKYAINIAQECRESVAYMMARSDGTERATLNHLIPLLDELRRLKPEMFEPGGMLHDYLMDVQAKHEKQGPADPARRILKR
ncbi:MAG: DUF166 family protein [Candidatus Sigynarchaeum springense]